MLFYGYSLSLSLPVSFSFFILQVASYCVLHISLSFSFYMLPLKRLVSISHSLYYILSIWVSPFLLFFLNLNRSFYFISFSFSLTLSFSRSLSLSLFLSPSLFSKLHFAHKLKNSKNRILVKEIFWIFHLAFKKIERCKKEFGEKQVLRLSLNLKLHKIQQFYFHDDWSRSQWLEHSTESCEFESRTEHPRFPFDPTFCCTFIASVFNQSVTLVLLGALC